MISPAVPQLQYMASAHVCRDSTGTGSSCTLHIEYYCNVPFLCWVLAFVMKSVYARLAKHKLVWGFVSGLRS